MNWKRSIARKSTEIRDRVPVYLGRRVMKIEMDKDFRGNTYIVHNEELLLSYSGGFADLANEIPNTMF